MIILIQIINDFLLNKPSTANQAGEGLLVYAISKHSFLKSFAITFFRQKNSPGSGAINNKGAPEELPVYRKYVEKL